LALLCCAATTPAFCATPSDALVMAWNIDNISTFDPAQIGETTGYELLQNTCDSLVDFDPADESKVIPALAESWEVSEDNTRISFRIRDGLVFPSGNAATASDLAWSMHRALTLNLGASAYLTEWGFTTENAADRIVAPDERTLVLKFDKPYSPQLILQAIGTSRSASAILDRKLLLGNEQDGDLGNKYLVNRTACVGAYSLAQWNAGESIVLQSNENYWGKKPALSRVLIRHVAEPGTQRLLLEQGDIDVARDLTTNDVSDLEKAPNVVVQKTLRPQLFYWMFNVGDPIFSNMKVRQAMRYLVDYQGLGDTVMKNLGRPRSSFVPLGSVGALDEKAGAPFALDLEKAKTLLAEAGYPDGFEATVLATTAIFVAPVAQSIQQNAAKINVKLNIETAANPQVAGKVRAREFSAAMMAWQADYPDAHNNASRWVYNPDNSMEAKLTQYPSWRASFQDQAMNETVLAALLEADPAKRADLYHDLQTGLMETGPYTVMFQTYYLAATRKELLNWTWNGFRNYSADVSK
jgi:peptide/nickel transport system substrate-binding protein